MERIFGSDDGQNSNQFMMTGFASCAGAAATVD